MQEHPFSVCDDDWVYEELEPLSEGFKKALEGGFLFSLHLVAFHTFLRRTLDCSPWHFNTDYGDANHIDFINPDPNNGKVLRARVFLVGSQSDVSDDFVSGYQHTRKRRGTPGAFARDLEIFCNELRARAIQENVLELFTETDDLKARPCTRMACGTTFTMAAMHLMNVGGKRYVPYLAPIHEGYTYLLVDVDTLIWADTGEPVEFPILSSSVVSADESLLWSALKQTNACFTLPHPRAALKVLLETTGLPFLEDNTSVEVHKNDGSVLVKVTFREDGNILKFESNCVSFK